MIIPLQALIDFKKDSVFIKNNNIIPILNYIKFSPGVITKDNLNQFIDYNCDAVTESLLIEERVLFNFLSVAKSDINIEIKGGVITLSDGSIIVKTKAEDVNLYPKHASPDDLQSIPSEVFASIYCAAQFISDDTTMGVKSFVFSGNDHVAGTDGFIAYIEEVKDSPDLILDKQTALKVGSFVDMKFCDDNKYYHFINDKASYGFIKFEQPFFDLSPLKKSGSTPTFTTSKKQWIDFNNLSMSSTLSKTTTCTFTYNHAIEMVMNDPVIDIKQTLPMLGGMDGSFTYNPAHMNRLLSAVPDETLDFYQEKNKFIIKGSNFITLIQEII